MVTLPPDLIVIAASKDSTETRCWAVKLDVVLVIVPIPLRRVIPMPLSVTLTAKTKTWYVTVRKAMQEIDAMCVPITISGIQSYQVGLARSAIAMIMLIRDNPVIAMHIPESA